MKSYLFNPRARAFLAAGAASLVVACVGAGPASASRFSNVTGGAGMTGLDASTCTDPSFTQPFLPFRDSNWYTLVPGETPGSFQGNGWTLGAGAQVVSGTLANGRAGSTLNLPSGAYAVSPPVCVRSDYPSARAMVRDVVGKEGIQFGVSYQGTKTWADPQGTGQLHGTGTSWSAANPVKIHAGNASGWQVVRFLFVAGGKTSDFQLYDFYVDPRMKL
jgi:hypothetical protein